MTEEKNPTKIRQASCCRMCSHFRACVNEFRDSSCGLFQIHVSPFDICDNFHVRLDNTDGFHFYPEHVDE